MANMVRFGVAIVGVHGLLGVALAQDISATPVSPSPAEEATFEPHGPAVLHAEALAAELDGDIDRALELLDDAAVQDPDDDAILYDRIRLSTQRDERKALVDEFLRSPPAGAQLELLKARIYVERQEPEGARAPLTNTLLYDPGNADAIALAHSIGFDPYAAQGPKRFMGRARLMGQYDSNVQVLPELQPNQTYGARGVIDIAAVWLPVLEPVRVELGAVMQYGPHFNRADQPQRDDQPIGQKVSELDTTVVVAFGSVSLDAGVTTWSLELTGTDVVLNSFRDNFMLDGRGRLSGGVRLGELELKLFGSGGYRDFDTPADQPNRDGARLGGGLTARWVPDSAWSLNLEGGFAHENASDTDFRARGPRGQAVVRWSPTPVTLSGTGVYEMRDYYRSGTDRVDQRITGMLTARWGFTEILGLFASYAYIHNLSNQTNLAYSRHIASLGVDATW